MEKEWERRTAAFGLGKGMRILVLRINPHISYKLVNKVEPIVWYLWLPGADVINYRWLNIPAFSIQSFILRVTKMTFVSKIVSKSYSRPASRLVWLLSTRLLLWFQQVQTCPPLVIRVGWFKLIKVTDMKSEVRLFGGCSGFRGWQKDPYKCCLDYRVSTQVYRVIVLLNPKFA